MNDINDNFDRKSFATNYANNWFIHNYLKAKIKIEYFVDNFLQHSYMLSKFIIITINLDIDFNYREINGEYKDSKAYHFDLSVFERKINTPNISIHLTAYDTLTLTDNSKILCNATVPANDIVYNSCNFIRVDCSYSTFFVSQYHLKIMSTVIAFLYYSVTECCSFAVYLIDVKDSVVKQQIFSNESIIII